MGASAVVSERGYKVPASTSETCHRRFGAQVPNALNGKFSWYNSGLAYGVWLGILAAYAMPFQVPQVV